MNTIVRATPGPCPESKQQANLQGIRSRAKTDERGSQWREKERTTRNSISKRKIDGVGEAFGELLFLNAP